MTRKLFSLVIPVVLVLLPSCKTVTPTARELPSGHAQGNFRCWLSDGTLACRLRTGNSDSGSTLSSKESFAREENGKTWFLIPEEAATDSPFAYFFVRLGKTPAVDFCKGSEPFHDGVYDIKIVTYQKGSRNVFWRKWLLRNIPRSQGYFDSDLSEWLLGGNADIQPSPPSEFENYRRKH